MLTGTLFALAAGLMWGLVFIAPLLLPEYPAALQSFGRYLAFGLIALPLAWLDRARLASLTRADWVEAMKLAAVGNIVYYLFLARAIQRAGAPLPTMIIGTLPVVIAISSNLRDAPARRQAALAAAAAVAGRSSAPASRWSTMSRSATCARMRKPISGAMRWARCWRWARWPAGPGTRCAMPTGCVRMPIARPAPGPRRRASPRCRWPWSAIWRGGPGVQSAAMASRCPSARGRREFVALMFAVGLLASWLGTLCWNEASQRLPTTLVGQLIVFETLSALAYAFMLRGRAPEPQTLAGIALLVAGVLWALRVRPEPVVVHGA